MWPAVRTLGVPRANSFLVPGLGQVGDPELQDPNETQHGPDVFFDYRHPLTFSLQVQEQDFQLIDDYASFRPDRPRPRFRLVSSSAYPFRLSLKRFDFKV